ncbi:MAG: TonB C-terminal domain-containing protein [Phenylobacterium sp.]
MKAQLLMLSAAGLLFAAQPSHAAPSEVQQYAERAHAQADALLAAARVNLSAAGVSVRATVAADGRLRGLQVVRSSGSRDTDAVVETALRKLVVADPPVGLIGGAVTLNVGAAPLGVATAR